MLIPEFEAFFNDTPSQPSVVIHQRIVLNGNVELNNT